MFTPYSGNMGHSVAVNKVMCHRCPSLFLYFCLKVSVCSYRAGFTVRAVFRSAGPDECCKENFKCQETMFLTHQEECSSLSIRAAPKGPGSAAQEVKAAYVPKQFIQFRQGSKWFVTPVWGVDFTKHLSVGEVATFAPCSKEDLGRKGQKDRAMATRMLVFMQDSQAGSCFLSPHRARSAFPWWAKVWCEQICQQVFKKADEIKMHSAFDSGASILKHSVGSSCVSVAAAVNVSPAFQMWTGCSRRSPVLNPLTEHTHIKVSLSRSS